MTFDEWMLTKDKSYVPTDDSMSLRLLRECWFSRDAKIAELVAALEQCNRYAKATLPTGYLALFTGQALAKVRKP